MLNRIYKIKDRREGRKKIDDKVVLSVVSFSFSLGCGRIASVFAWLLKGR
jgi:hypothetical protein